MPFQFVEIPDAILPVIGEPDPGTRIFRQSGPQSHSADWFEAISMQFGGLLSPGGVSMYAPVSRAAVHKRLKEGRMTAFCFHPEEVKRGLFKEWKGLRETPTCYIPSSEAKSWREEIMERLERQGHLTREDLEGDRPDWRGDFFDWHSKWRRKQFKAAGRKVGE